MRLGFVGSMAALLAGTGLVLAQAPDYQYQYVQSGTLPARQVLPATTMNTQAAAPATAPENGNAVPVTNSSGYDCLGCNAGCGAGHCASGLCNNTMDVCAPTPYTTYGKLEFLIWNIQRSELPAASGLPLGTQLLPVTTSADTFLVPVNAVVSANVPGSDTRLGGEHFGSRATVGFWLDSQSHCGFEISGFFLERRGSSVSNAVGPQQVTPEEGRIVIPNPGAAEPTVLDANFFLTSGASEVSSSISNELWGFEINGRCGRYYLGCFSIGSLAGFRYLDFREDLSSRSQATLGFADGSDITEVIVPDLGDPIEVLVSEGATVGANTLILFSADTVQTRNQWFGYQVGADFEWGCGPCFVNGFAKVGLGAMHQAADVTSSANPTINGHYTRNRVSGIMEGSLSVGYALTPCIRTYLGYDYLYMMRVARPDRLTTNSTNALAVNVAGTDVVFDQAIVPVFRFTDRDMWVQGVHFGLEFRY